MFALSLLASAADAVPLPTGYGWALIKMLLALVVVCAAAYVLLRFGLKRLASGPRGLSRSMRVVERCPLATGRNLWIVEAGGRFFLLGEAEGGISNLAELTKDQVPEPIEEKRTSFLEILKRRPRV